MSHQHAQRTVRRAAWIGLGLLLGGLTLTGLLPAQSIHTNGFEAPKTVWVKGSFDAPYDLKTHAITDLAAHGGKRSEHIALNARAGRFIHFQYTTGKAPLGEEFSAGVWVKANRPGIRLRARIVLPNEREPTDLQNLLTLTLDGDAYQRVGQWQRLALGRATLLLAKERGKLEERLKHAPDLRGAYVDTLLLNLYAGPGPTEVWLDDLEVGPLVSEFRPTARPTDRPDGSPGTLTRPGGRAPVEFTGNQLSVGTRRVFFRAIRFTDTMLRPLSEAGFNTVFFQPEVSDALLTEAAREGLWVVPELPVVHNDGKPIPPEEVKRLVNRFAGNDSVLFLRFGGMFAYEQSQLVARAAKTLRTTDPTRLLAFDAWDGLMPYSRTAQLLGVHRWPLMTAMELPQYRAWLEQRQQLTRPGAFTWTWIQTHMPEWYTQLLYGRGATAAFNEPIGPQPEQIRLLTYTALASGCRGLAFYSDRFLADSHQGRDRLLVCALLNQEIDMLETLLVSVEEVDRPEWVDTSDANVKAAVLRCAKGTTLVLPIWQGPFSQLVPGQAAVNKLAIVVPQAPPGTQAWEITPGEVRRLRNDRVVFGQQVVLPEFGMTSAIVFTSDRDLVARLQEQARVRRQKAAQWTYDLAQAELEKVLVVQRALEGQGQTIPEAARLLQDAQRRLQQTKTLWENRVFAEAYREGQRVLRPLHILMRKQWEKAARGLDAPTSSPYVLSYYTLPRHWQFMQDLRRCVPAANALPAGDFEENPDRPTEPWRKELMTLDEVDLLAHRVGSVVPPRGWDKDDKLRKSPFYFSAAPRQGQRCAMLQVRPKVGKAIPRALDRTYLALSSPQVKLPPGSLVRLSAWINVPASILASPDGALFYDSAGGEPLAVRLTQTPGWKKYVLYRRVPTSGVLQVTLALTGVGTVFFDDVRIQPLQQTDNPDALAETERRETEEEKQRPKQPQRTGTPPPQPAAPTTQAAGNARPQLNPTRP